MDPKERAKKARKEEQIMKKKLIAAILTGAMLAAGMSTGVWADGGKVIRVWNNRIQRGDG